MLNYPVATTSHSNSTLIARRRQLIRFATAGLCGAVLGESSADEVTRAVDIRGIVLVNSKALLQGQAIQSGDTIETGSDSRVIFVIGASAFDVRQRSRVKLERGPTLNSVGLLLLTRGAVLSAWNQTAPFRLQTPGLIADVRGTGTFFLQYSEDPRRRSYICNCHGSILLKVAQEHERSESDDHDAFWAEPDNPDGEVLMPARVLNHERPEVDSLARRVQLTLQWPSGVRDKPSPSLGGSVNIHITN